MLEKIRKLRYGTFGIQFNDSRFAGRPKRFVWLAVQFYVNTAGIAQFKCDFFSGLPLNDVSYGELMLLRSGVVNGGG